MYIRVKKRQKDKQYAYLVISKRRYKKPQQKTLKYLGKVLDLGSQNTTPYTLKDNDKFSQKQYSDIILELIKNEIKQLGFNNAKGNLFLKDNYKIDLSNFIFQTIEKRPFVVKLNQGFLCKYTVSHLINFKFGNKTQKECINLFANQLVSTGINIDKELFILLFKKIYTQEN